LNSNEKLLQRKFGKQNMVVSHTKSEYINWQYVISTPLAVYNSKVEYVKLLIIISLIIYVIICSIAIFYITKKNYSPIKLIASMFNNDDTESDIDEYHYIQMSIKSMISEKKELVGIVDKQRETLKNNIIVNLLKGNFKGNISEDELVEHCGINFVTDKFAVALIKVEDYSDLFEDDNLEMVHFVIANVIKEIISKNHIAEVVIIDRVLAVLINFKDDSIEYNKYISNSMLTAQSILSEKMFIYFSSAQSNVHSGLSAINTAYIEVLYAMKYTKIFGNNKVILYNDIKNCRDNFDYDAEISERLLNNIKVGSETSIDIVKSVFDKNFVEPTINIETANYLIFAITNTILRGAHSVCDKEFINQLNLVARVDACSTIDEIKDVMQQTINSICNYLNKRDETETIIDRVIDYVKINYSSNQLNVTDIGEQFNITPSYISRIFKERFGETLPNYINKLRILKAKELLKENKMSIITIAHKIGYVNSNVFIRNFKKYEGITPGQYKDIQ